MLRNLMIMTGSGVTLFEKEWVQLIEKTRLFGSLVTSMLEYAKQSTGMAVSYVAFSQVAVTIVQDEWTGLICTLWHDVGDGPMFGRTVSQQLLRAFIDEHSAVDFSTTVSMNQFEGWSNKIVDALQTCFKFVLQQLKLVHGISACMLLFDFDDSQTITTGSVEDQLGLIASLQALVTFSDEMLTPKHDGAQMVTLELGGRSKVLVNRTGPAWLVTVAKKRVSPEAYEHAVVDAVTVCESLFELIDNLGGT